MLHILRACQDEVEDADEDGMQQGFAMRGRHTDWYELSASEITINLFVYDGLQKMRMRMILRCIACLTLSVAAAAADPEIIMMMMMVMAVI